MSHRRGRRRGRPRGATCSTRSSRAGGGSRSSPSTTGRRPRSWTSPRRCWRRTGSRSSRPGRRARRPGRPAAPGLPAPDADSVARTVAAALAADDDALEGSRMAVVTPRSGYGYLASAVASALDGDLAARVDVLSVDEVKGLEFDAVTVVDPQAVLA